MVLCEIIDSWPTDVLHYNLKYFSRDQKISAAEDTIGWFMLIVKRTFPVIVV